MGTDCYIVDHQRRELFHLGRGPWHESLLKFQPMYEYVETNTHLVNADPAVARKMLRDVWGWCQERDWAVELMSDSNPSYSEVADYEETGHFTLEGEIYPDELMMRIGDLAKDLRIDLCAEEIEIKVVIPDPDSDMHLATRYHSIVGDHIVRHGYLTDLRKCSCGGGCDDEDYE